jgi:hypothetical protein
LGPAWVSGGVTRTVGVPGSGVSYCSSTTRGSGSRGSSAAAGRSRAAAIAAPAAPPKPASPGLFAPKWEKELHRALIAKPDVNEPARIGSQFEQARPLAALFEAVRGAIPNGNYQRGWNWPAGSLAPATTRPRTPLSPSTSPTTDSVWGSQTVSKWHCHWTATTSA